MATVNYNGRILLVMFPSIRIKQTILLLCKKGTWFKARLEVLKLLLFYFTLEKIIFQIFEWFFCSKYEKELYKINLGRTGTIKRLTLPILIWGLSWPCIKTSIKAIYRYTEKILTFTDRFFQWICLPIQQGNHSN